MCVCVSFHIVLKSQYYLSYLRHESNIILISESPTMKFVVIEFREKLFPR